MSDEAPRNDEDTPNTQDADTDWQKRYSDLQPEYTRATQALKDEQGVWENEEALLARIQEKYPHLVQEETDEDEDDDTFDPSLLDDDPRLAKVDALEEKSKAYDEFMAAQAQKEATELFNKDLAETAGDRTLSRQAKEWIFNETVRLGDGKENLQKAFEAWVEYEDSVGEQYLERVKKSKRAPRVAANGKATTDTPNWADLSEGEQAELMAEMVRARSQ